MKLFRRHWLLTTILFLGLCAAVFVGLPSNRVRISATHLPPDTSFNALVAETSEGVRLMDWSVRVPFLGTSSNAHPVRCTWSWPLVDPTQIGMTWNAFVRWEWGTRYGILTMNQAGKWLVFWFAPEDVPLEGRGFWQSNGHAHFDLIGKRPENFPREDLKKLGLSELKPHARD
jgi:hypothetical protein